MATYSTYEAKARFSEILRRVRLGETVRITYYGEEIAEVRPVEPSLSTEARLDRLVESGILEKAQGGAHLQPLASKRGALERFLEDRD